MLAEFLRRNLSYKLISFLVAIILWGYVTNEQNPITEQTFEIPIETKGVQNSLVILDMPKTVKVTIQTAKLSFNNFSPKTIVPFVDLSEITNSGEATFPVEITNNSDVKILEVKPNSIKVNVDYIDTRSYTIKVKPVGKLTNNAFIKSSKLTPEVVRITGSQTQLNKIDSVVVTPELNDQEELQSFSLPIKLLDIKGHEIPNDQLKLSQHKVMLELKIDKEITEQDKPIQPSLSGQVPQGYFIDRVEVEPKNAKLSGELANLNKVKYIHTETIKLDGIVKDLVTYINLKSPENTVLKNIKKVKVTIFVKPVVLQRNITQKIQVKNPPQGMEYTIDNDKLNLLLAGSAEALNKIDIQAWIDLKGLTGTANVKVNYLVPKGITVVSATPAEVKVTIQKEPAKP